VAGSQSQGNQIIISVKAIFKIFLLARPGPFGCRHFFEVLVCFYGEKMTGSLASEKFFRCLLPTILI